jgi:hypothetical protein
MNKKANNKLLERDAQNLPLFQWQFKFFLPEKLTANWLAGR